MPSPVTFCCHARLPVPPTRICEWILDLSLWPAFHGYWFLPGIRSADFELRTPEVVGTRIRVRNTDGSSHVETIAEWQPENRVRLEFSDFTPPLSRLSAGFTENWTFQFDAGETHVERSFELRPKNFIAKVVLWFISLFLKRAIRRHLRDMSRDSLIGDAPPSK